MAKRVSMLTLLSIEARLEKLIDITNEEENSGKGRQAIGDNLRHALVAIRNCQTELVQ
jgi:hypothetical protein